ncbi:MAG: hypothetical protein M3N26_09340, partial [Pseudomonadota bacterium]|nr:hypothetical protein [Pseudomonadota bacterium]
AGRRDLGRCAGPADSRDRQRTETGEFDDERITMRFGLIGLGSIGQVRRTAIGLTPGCSLTAVFDADPAR